MTVVELQKKLTSQGIDSRCYSLDGTSPALEGFVLAQEKGMWRVDFFERGVFSTLAEFLSSADACDFFYQKIMRDFGKSPNA